MHVQELIKEEKTFTNLVHIVKKAKIYKKIYETNFFHIRIDKLKSIYITTLYKLLKCNT